MAHHVAKAGEIHNIKEFKFGDTWEYDGKVSEDLLINSGYVEPLDIWADEVEISQHRYSEHVSVFLTKEEVIALYKYVTSHED